jgi:hypothetical protein
VSRTTRRKNYDQTRNKSWHRAGRKTAGVLTAWYRYEPSTNGHNGVKIYQKMIAEDLRWRKVNLFGESKHHNAYGPSREYRNAAERQNRRYNDRELRRTLGNPEYEGQFRARYRADWDSYYW